jgi:hypothetical protein
MSNQTFVKKDRISFAQNLNEKLVIAPSNLTTNALFLGPNSAISYDGNSNIQTINTLAGVTLSNQYIYADGTYLSNLPNGIQQSNIDSTIRGLATFGYVSSTQLQSTVQGLGNIYISSAGGGVNQSQLVSTVIGLGNIYISTAGGGISQTELTSTSIGLGNLGYVSSLRSISSLNISTGNLFSGVISSLEVNTSSVRANILTGPNSATLTTNLYPQNPNSVVVGYGSNTGQGGYYAQGNFRSTFTQVIHPSLDSNAFSNIVRIQGNTLAQNINVSSIFASTISTNIVVAQFLRGSGTFGNLVYTTTLLPDTNNVSGLGNGPINSYSQIVGSNIRCFNIENQFGNSINSTVRVLGTLSTQNQVASSIRTNILFATSNVSTQTFIGSNTFVNTIQPYNTSRILASFIHPISDFPTTAYEIGSAANRWMRSFQASTVTSVIVPLNTGTTPTGIVDINSTVRVLGTLSTMNINTSSITGDGSRLFNLNAVSSLSLESTITGLGTFGYVSSPSLFSSIQSYNFVSTSSLQSTVAGLGTVGYVSTASLFSSIQSYNFVSTSSLQSTVAGLGTVGYISAPSLFSSIQSYNFVSTSSLQSTVAGLGTVGYISAASLFSSIQSYNFVSTSSLQSTVAGLGTVGYVSTPSLFSSIQSYNFVSTSSLQSTVAGLGTVGYVSTPSLFSSIQSYNFVSTSSLRSTVIGLGTVGLY